LSNADLFIKKRLRLALPGALALLLAATAAREASAQAADVSVRATLFHEGSATSALTVVNPNVSASAHLGEAIDLNAAYEADIVTGASEAIKGGELTDVDIVSSATSFSDVRHVGSFGFGLNRENTQLVASYSYGTEHDYRSHALSVLASTDFLQKNTEIAISYGRGFDKTCTSAFTSTTAPTARQPLDSSEGCFTDADNRATRDVNIDSFQAAWTQNWTPVLNSQLVLTGSLQNGFLANPYRAVIIAPAGDQALEHHPTNRARAALALRGKYFFKELRAALTVSGRLYRDTWDLFAQTYELEGEKYLSSDLRLMLHARVHDQTGALFWSDDYTGGEPKTGPRGQYWTGDRELSPLTSYLVGGRLSFSKNGSPDDRLLGLLLDLDTAVSLDLMKTYLHEFTWGGRTPDDTIALILTAGVGGEF
jgi:hypothetical protein